MIRLAIILSVAFATLAGCSDPTKAVYFDGKQFSGRLQADKEDKRSFTATSAPVSQSLEGAREAARFEGTTYCVRKYGRSEIDWIASPEADATALNISEDVLTVQGRCAE
jgi:hypothetical protein